MNIEQITSEANEEYLKLLRLRPWQSEEVLRSRAIILYHIYNKNGIEAMIAHIEELGLLQEKIRSFIMNDDQCPLSEADKVYYMIMEMGS